MRLCAKFARLFVIALGGTVIGGCNGGGSQIAPVVPVRQSVAPPRIALAQKPPSFIKWLYAFKGAPSDGALPGGMFERNGVIYGTTSQGGANNYGTIFTVTKTGEERIFYAFQGPPYDGAAPGPASWVTLRGVLYGTTLQGGTGDCKVFYTAGCGTVYTISTSGQEKVLYSFQRGQDGALPNSLVVLDGKLYGTTERGGGLGCGGGGCGTVFSVTPSGKEKVLYAFGTLYDGNYPSALIAVRGTLYGTTFSGGGCYASVEVCGTFFSLTKSGTEKILYEFQGYPNDGSNPQGQLIDVKGTLYGTTATGGGAGYCPDAVAQGCGTVYSITTSGQENVLHAFRGVSFGPPLDGGIPEAGVIAVNGAFWGTTDEGGSGQAGICYNGHFYPVGCGTIFNMTMSGQESIFYNFSGGNDGAFPAGRLAAVKRALYGTATAAGANNLGTVFKTTDR